MSPEHCKLLYIDWLVSSLKSLLRKDYYYDSEDIGPDGKMRLLEVQELVMLEHVSIGFAQSCNYLCVL